MKPVELKDIIHLYIGQKFLYKVADVDTEWSKPMVLTCDQLCCYYQLVNDPDCEYKLILRPLDSMTEEDVRELSGYNNFADSREIIKFDKDNQCASISYRWKPLQPALATADGYRYSSNAVYYDKQEWSPKNTIYLLSKGFDLFNAHSRGLCIYESETLK